jgi:hypothetical protein
MILSKMTQRVALQREVSFFSIFLSSEWFCLESCKWEGFWKSTWSSFAFRLLSVVLCFSFLMRVLFFKVFLTFLCDRHGHRHSCAVTLKTILSTFLVIWIVLFILVADASGRHDFPPDLSVPLSLKPPLRETLILVSMLYKIPGAGPFGWVVFFSASFYFGFMSFRWLRCHGEDELCDLQLSRWGLQLWVKLVVDRKWWRKKQNIRRKIS